MVGEDCWLLKICNVGYKKVSMGNALRKDDLSLLFGGETLSFIETFDREGDINLLLSALKEHLDLSNLAYFSLNNIESDSKEPFFCATYSKDWVEHYKVRNYVQDDPVLYQSFRSLLPSDWFDFSKTTPRVKEFFGEANEFKVGRNGLSIPIRGFAGEKAVFSIASNDTQQEWMTFKRGFMRDFIILAQFIHDKTTGISELLHNPPKLAPREIECLYWASHGKTVSETAIIMGISVYTVRSYIETARYHLNSVTVTQAVAKAIKLNLLPFKLG